MVERQKQFDAAQKLLVRALDPAFPREQKIAIRKLFRSLLAGQWAPHEIVLAWSGTSSEFAEIMRLHAKIENLEQKVRLKESRILELAGDLHKQRTNPGGRILYRNGKACKSPAPAAVSPSMGTAAWNSKVNELQIALHQLETKFGFGDNMRLAINHWYQGLPSNEKTIGREAGRNWLRQHAGWEHGRLIPDGERLRWRKVG